MNSSLKNAIESAKWENVPNDNIKRAIEKWSWTWSNAVNYQEVIYESYAPWWSALIIEALTDNKIRTMSNIKTILNKNWWKFAEPGSVWYMFEKKWIIEIFTEEKNIEDLEMFILESWAENFEVFENENFVKITTNLSEVSEIKNKFLKNWYKIKKFWLEYISNQ
jgi:transcriptional/translational regulatory protein YebC/TACO1